MPELPEVEVIRRDLEKEIVGRRIKAAEVRAGSNAMKVVKRHGRRKEFQDLLVGSKIDKVDRRGKEILFDLDNDNVLVVDLAATGVLVKTSASEEIAPHTHIVIDFTIGGQLRLIDPKLSSSIFVVPGAEVRSGNGLAAIDPLDNQQPLSWHHFSSLLEQRETALKELLMDEDFIVGLGDVYSDEVLFAAGLRYDRPSNQLSSQDVRRLYRGLSETLHDAVKARGTSWGSEGFKDLQGNPGAYQLELKVYEREGEACRRCRSEVVREEVDGSYTYFCPQCQS